MSLRKEKRNWRARKARKREGLRIGLEPPKATWWLWCHERFLTKTCLLSLDVFLVQDNTCNLHTWCYTLHTVHALDFLI